jgi:hypothetical protein
MPRAPHRADDHLVHVHIRRMRRHVNAFATAFVSRAMLLERFHARRKDTD